MSAPSRARGVRVLVMAGGTGGHVYPALAVAELLRARGVDVAWLGTRAGLESSVVPGAGFPIHYVRVSGLRGKGVLRVLGAPLMLLAALAHGIALLARLRPSVVLGMGGFTSGPGGVAAWLLHRPLVLHEQNAVPGLTNRVLAHLACRVLEAFPGCFGGDAEPVGNPVRAAIAALAEPGVRFARRAGALRVLVLGGSQGARALNEVVPAGLRALPAEVTVEVWHQAGQRNLSTARAAYEAAGVHARVDAYLEDMAAAYAWADLVVCRAGAMTVAELAAAGVASVLVPFPHAVDDHQTRNARYLADAGAAVLLPQSELDAGRLAALLAELRAAPGRLLDMARRARALAVTDAAERIADVCLEVARA